MTDVASDQRPIYFPQPRHELAKRLCEGDRILDAAMVKTGKAIPVGQVLVPGGEHNARKLNTLDNVCRFCSIGIGSQYPIYRHGGAWGVSTIAGLPKAR